MQIKGYSKYSMTTKPNEKGKYPSHCYEVGITDIEIVNTKNQDEKDWLTDYIADKSKDVDIVDEDNNIIGTQSMLKIANSKFPIPMFNLRAEPYDTPVALPNGTAITLELEKRHNYKYDKDYLIVKAIQVNEELKQYNPFK